MTRTVVLIPWRTDNGPRAGIYEHVRAQIDSLDLPVFEGDTDSEVFNICGAWNAAARTAGDWDVALFWGADFTLASPRTAIAAASLAEIVAPYVFAFDKVTKLTRPETLKHHATGDIPHRDDPLPFGGVRAVNRAWWDRVGGYDERFQGWGHGDRAYVHVMERLGGRPSRVRGRMILHRHPGRAHLPDDPYYRFQAANLTLLKEYQRER